MRYSNVCIEGLGYEIPEHVVTSSWIEEQLEPVYRALEIPMGMMEGLTGIKERRWWDDGVVSSDGAMMAAESVLANTGVDRSEIECIINASVVRDYVEPSTATIVHHKLGLPSTALNFDVTNACLGFLNGMVVVANMIELGQIQTGLVVSAEGARDGQLQTIERLLDSRPSRASCFENLAGFTIGSGAVAMILTHRNRSRTGRSLLGGYAYSETQHHPLCVADAISMKTNSRELLREGLKVIGKAWQGFQNQFGWEPQMIDRVFTHQVSEKQRVLGRDQLGFVEGQDYPTLRYLGNIASVSAPLGLALAEQNGDVHNGDRLCMIGVGSGINSMVLGMEW